MKRKGILIAVSLLLVLGLILAGCAKAPTTPTATTPKPTTPTATTPKPTTTAPTPTAPETITWRGQESFTKGPAHGPVPVTGYGLPGYVFSDWVAQATHGQLVIDWAPPASIFPIAETFNSVSQGVVPIAECWANYYAGSLPEAAIEAWLPFNADYYDDSWVVLYFYGLAEKIKEAYAEHNIYCIPALAGCKYNAIGANFPITSPDTIKGKKIRAPGSYGDLIQMLGGAPVNLPWGEMYMGMKLGTIDGWMGGISALDEVKMSEVTPYYLKTCIAYAYLNILINMDAWNALPDDVKELIETQAPYVMTWSGQQEVTAEEWLATNITGTTFNYWSAEDLARVRKQAIDTIWPKFAAASPRCAEMIAIWQKFLVDYGRV